MHRQSITVYYKAMLLSSRKTNLQLYKSLSSDLKSLSLDHKVLKNCQGLCILQTVRCISLEVKVQKCHPAWGYAMVKNGLLSDIRYYLLMSTLRVMLSSFFSYSCGRLVLPWHTTEYVEYLSPAPTRCVRPVMKLLIHDRTLSRWPNEWCSLWMRMSWSTVSKAVDILRGLSSVTSLQSAASRKSETTWGQRSQPIGLVYRHTRLVTFLRNRLGLKVNGKCETKLAMFFWEWYAEFIWSICQVQYCTVYEIWLPI